MNVKLEGLEKSIGKLKELQGKMAKKYVSKALRAGAKVTQSQAKADAPEKTGRTKAAIKVRAGKRKRGRVTMLVSIGPGWFSGETYYASFEVLGHKTGKRGSENRKEVPGKDWYKNALDKAADASLSKIRETLRQLIEGDSE